MSKITTEGCKQYLTEQFPELSAKDWKRTRKYKNDNSDWCRDFSHKTGINITLIEVDGKLCMSDDENFSSKKEIEIKDPNKVLYYKKFDDSLIKAAKKIVKKYTDYEDDEFEVTPEMKGYDAIPNLISFFFCGPYTPDTKITKEISFNMDFSIFFSPVTDKYFDQHLQPLIADFLPTNFGEESECEFAPFYENEDEALTINEIMKELLDRGFIYDVKRCDLKESFEDYTIIPKMVEVSVIDESIEKELIDVIKKDDAKKLNELIINDKIKINHNIKSTNILNYCYKNDKKLCFKVLISHIDNLANYNSGKKHIFNILQDEIKDKEYIEKYLTIILNDAKMDFDKNDYLSLIDAAMIPVMSFRNDLRFNAETSGFKQAIFAIQKFLNEKQFGEAVLLSVLHFRMASEDKVLMDIALKFIDDYKQEAITPTIQIKIHGRDSSGLPTPEAILDKLIQYDIKIGDFSLYDFFKIQVKRYSNCDSVIYCIDKNGQDAKYLIYAKDMNAYWNKQIEKLKGHY